MRAKFTEQDVDKILKGSKGLKREVVINSNFTANVMDRIRKDSTIEVSRSFASIIAENIYLKFTIGTTAIAAASIILAFGLLTQTAYTFEEYAIADYIINAI